MPPKPTQVAARWLRKAATTPLPNQFPDSEMGLMTLDTFLQHRNPQEKFHDPESYDFDLNTLNRTHEQHLGRIHFNTKAHDLYKTSHGYLVKTQDEGTLLGVVEQGTLYHDTKLPVRHTPQHYYTFRQESVPFPIEQTRPIKYIHEQAALVDPMVKRNLANLPHLLQHIKIKGQALTVRAEKDPAPNKGTRLGILNANGQIIATAQDEWGATLIAVAKEYRGMGLGRTLGRYWYDLNPAYPSGGFTPAGQANAIRLWKDRVREFLAQGWYSALIQDGRLNKNQLNKILADLGERKPKPPSENPDSHSQTKGQTLIMVDEGAAFFIYNSRIYDQPATDLDPKLIHGYGFFRNSGNKTFLYALDYDRKYHKLTTYTALQMARNEGYLLYNGEGYGDILELKGLNHIQESDDHAQLTKDMIPLNQIARLEQNIRRKHDPYDEYQTMIMEAAESKW